MPQKKGAAKNRHSDKLLTIKPYLIKKRKRPN